MIALFIAFKPFRHFTVSKIVTGYLPDSGTKTTHPKKSFEKKTGEILQCAD
jgi:hypothetical protein